METKLKYRDVVRRSEVKISKQLLSQAVLVGLVSSKNAEEELREFLWYVAPTTHAKGNKRNGDWVFDIRDNTLKGLTKSKHVVKRDVIRYKKPNHRLRQALIQQSTGSGDRITQEELHKVLDYGQGSGKFVWLIKPDNATDKYTVAGRRRANGHKYITLYGVDYKADKLAWFYVTGDWSATIVHRDGNNWNNRWINLATKDQIRKEKLVVAKEETPVFAAYEEALTEHELSQKGNII